MCHEVIDRECVELGKNMFQTIFELGLLNRIEFVKISFWSLLGWSMIHAH